MPSDTPRPGRPGAPPRRGLGGLAGLLAVLAFVILAAVVLMRQEPGTVAELPPASPAVPATPATTLAPPPPEVPPSTVPAASAPPVAPVEEPPLPGKAARPARPADAVPAPRGARVADADPSAGRSGPGAPPVGSSSRRFVLGTTSIESLKPVQRDLEGFDRGGVGLKRAPEVIGRVELEMDPPQVRPGVDYTVKVYLANDGSRDIAVQEVKVSTLENGKSATRTATPRARSVKPRQRELLHEVSGVWREAARSWAMDVVVTSGRQDIYRNQLRWE
jgi:hypothetical protein